jgi:cellulose biosynthesis protein BcsQ
MRIIALYNIKGGVGKTAGSVNLAWLAAHKGYKTLLWDLDPQGAASFYFRVQPKVAGGGEQLVVGKTNISKIVKATSFKRLDLLPADFSYRNMDLMLAADSKPAMQLMRLLRPFSGVYDLLILDCPPSISLVSENIFRAADALLVPVIPTTLSVRTYQQLLEFLKKNDLTDQTRTMPYFSMVDLRKRLHKRTVERLPQLYPEVLTSQIPNSSDIERMGVMRSPVGVYAPKGAGGVAFAKLWNEVSSKLALP